MKEICVLLAIFSVALGAPSYESEGLLTSTIKFVKDCGDKSMVLCFKVRKNCREKCLMKLIIKKMWQKYNWN